jgi:hypothetical protein
MLWHWPSQLLQRKKKHAITSEASHKLVRSVAQEIGLQTAENRPRIETPQNTEFHAI